jgi:hypothetical protein
VAPRNISTRRRANPTQDEYIPESIFDTEAMAGLPKPEPRGKVEAKKEPTVAELLEKMGAMQERIDAQARETARATTVGNSTPTPTFAEPAPQLNLENLPDPVADPKAYAAEIATRTLGFQNTLTAYEARKRDALTPKPMGDPDAVFADFADQYPEYAQEEERLAFVTAQVSKKLSKRGVDVQKYLYQHTDQLFADLLKEYDAVFGKPGEELDGEDGEIEAAPAPRQRQRRARNPEIEDDEGDGRTEGILGNQEPGTRQAGNTPRPGDLIKDLQDMQRQSGYY